MTERNAIFFMALMIILSVLGFVLYYDYHRGIIIIKNNSPYPLTHVVINYQDFDKSYPLPDITPKSYYKYPIDYQNHNEQSSYIIYTKNGVRYQILASGYHASYSKEPYWVTIH